jgi:hypothetical protein
MAVHPGRRPLGESQLKAAQELVTGLDANLTEVQIIANDGAVLRGWSILPRHGNSNSVILLHGLSDNRFGMIGYAELLVSHGYGVLMPDSRAHGQSGGTFATYGLNEKNDIQQWVTWMHHSQDPNCIYGFGESMGAALILQALQTQPHFCAVAAESPFSSFREIAYDRVGQFFRAGPWVGRFVMRPTVEISFAYARWKYGLDLASISPEDDIGKSTVPVLLIHGIIDSNIPLRHSLRIQARNPGVALWQVPNADHCGAINADPDQFTARLLNWFRPH